MASEAQRNQKILDDELQKPVPNTDLIYMLKQTQNYWNTVDTDKMQRGAEALRKINADTKEESDERR